MGFGRTVIAGLEPLPREHLEEWLSCGYASGMEYLKRDLQLRVSPQLLVPQARSAIVVAVSYFTEAPPDPGPGWGKVAGYAVGLDYHQVLKDKLLKLKQRLETVLTRPLFSRALTDSTPLFEQAFARRAGLGFAGNNTLIIGPYPDGSYNLIGELFTDLDLEPDEPYQGTCGKCTRCLDICPTGALMGNGMLDANRCISYLTIENKDEIPVALRPGIGNWVFGCDLCQMVCPYNANPPLTPWVEFYPQSGVGHYLKLTDLLKISNQQEFKNYFRNTSLLRPKRRGLLRNALVVLGNQHPETALAALKEFLLQESDRMLQEHAAWAISQY